MPHCPSCHLRLPLARLRPRVDCPRCGNELVVKTWVGIVMSSVVALLLLVAAWHDWTSDDVPRRVPWVAVAFFAVFPIEFLICLLPNVFQLNPRSKRSLLTTLNLRGDDDSSPSHRTETPGKP